LSAEEAAESVDLAKRSPGYLLCAPHVILSPTYQAMWRHIHGGDIGQPLTARARYGWAGPRWGEWFYRPGGGALFDLGVYNVTTLTGLLNQSQGETRSATPLDECRFHRGFGLGPVKPVTAMTGVAIPKREVEGQRITVEAEDNAHVLGTQSQAAHLSHNPRR
jgi:predicted dehydrogenase